MIIIITIIINYKDLIGYIHKNSKFINIRLTRKKDKII